MTHLVTTDLLTALLGQKWLGPGGEITKSRPDRSGTLNLVQCLTLSLGQSDLLNKVQCATLNLVQCATLNQWPSLPELLIWGFFLQGRKSGEYFFQIGKSSENKSCLFLHPLHKKYNKKITIPTSTSNHLPSGSCLTMTLTETSTSNRLPSG